MKRNKLHCIALSVVSIFYSFHVTASQNIIVDNSKKRDLSVEIKNEIEHINIEKADENGISHNYYKKFNVSTKGAVLENTNEVAAKIIVNEVTSEKTSLLKGKLAVNGQPAELIIANPNGIKCVGCWFSGSSTQRLLVGKIYYTDKKDITKFKKYGYKNVQAGELLLATENGNIEFKGINRVHRSGDGSLDLISRHVAIMNNSYLFAKKISTIIGDNVVRISHENQLSIIGKSIPITAMSVTGLSIGENAKIQAEYNNFILTDNNSINNKKISVEKTRF
ncbi:filamentous hemagglutinin N-terminal domain-containing protein [Arsenophonus apicola]|uniref:Filamentous hemagglutinin N-terminal domain-containing protein n=1 Tax=Arsenophonus apicola TaxID=2879119 RepID=A0ABY8P2M6_9GAMM|nr:filamentous hemagglutinin N-terminal domain-containing protein [Arsenophonus apicola]WGO83467.1 filamentous hemagglutinin N-terminal domain-containing protein [Arsenophonus apicola]